jgi:DHA1 family bicyclomycin/chloramphenicol resistance-like MFS transporter
MASQQISLKLLFLIAALSALAPLGTDAYLPAMPIMAQSLHSTIHDIELSLSLFLAGFSVGQLMGGPLSDHFGRRPLVLTGLIVFGLGTLAIIFCSNLTELLLFRAIQALGGGLAFVNSNAIIRDISSGQDSARNLSYIAVIMMMAPLLAPMLGSSLLQFFSWHSIFTFLLIYTVLITASIYYHIPETRVISDQKISTIHRYWMVISHRRAIGYLCASCCSYGGMFAFITASPSVYMGYFELSTLFYPVVFGANIISTVLMTRLNVMLLTRFSAHQILSAGQFMQVGIGLSLLSYILIIALPSLSVVVALVMLFVGMQGLIVANAISSAIEFFPNNSGTASALLGASGFATGAFTGMCVGLLGDGTAYPMALVMAMSAVSGLLLRIGFQK